MKSEKQNRKLGGQQVAHHTKADRQNNSTPVHWNLQHKMNGANTMTTRAIKRIIVKKLFGMHDYELKAPSQAVDADRLLVLYGDNGSGKTTILKALFHLLSPESGQGHKGALVGLPLSRFEVEFTTGDRVWLQREDGQLIGGYTLGLRMGKKKEQICAFHSPDGIRVDPSEEITAFLAQLSNLNLALYYLSDDRTVRLAGVDRREAFSTNEEMFEKEMFLERVRDRNALDPELRSQHHLLVQSMKRAEQWIQSQVVRGSSQGESGVNALYAEILSRIANVPLTAGSAIQDDVNTLERRISTLEDRSKTYAIYGLLPAFNGKEIVKIVKSATHTHTSLVSSVLTPYLESVEKKLDAMENIQRQINALVVMINSFFSRKYLSYDIHKGFKIFTDDGKPINPQMLSSGERHLLLLFCNTIQALDKQSIFMIDEPEISLNIKWQRRLLPALRECAGQSPIQYLFATHSFEILAQCRDNTISLNDTPEQVNG
ncbi:MAG: AAA family ATPase [Gallionella sp.]|nr:AAA family ATPase [Gallionella sp.]